MDNLTNKIEYTLDAPNDVAYKKMLLILNELGLSYDDIEVTGDDI